MAEYYKRLAGRIRRGLLIFAHDLVMIPIAWLGSYWFRFNLAQIPDAYWSQGVRALPWVILVQACSFYFFDLHKGVWRFASLPDLVRIVKAVAVGTVACMALLFIFYRLEFIPRSMVLLYPVLLLILISGPRLLYRWSKDHRLEMSSGTRVLIVGAGQAGEMLAAICDACSRTLTSQLALSTTRADARDRRCTASPSLGPASKSPRS